MEPDEPAFPPPAPNRRREHRVAARNERRWNRVRVETDQGCFLGWVPLRVRGGGLRDWVDDARVYLGVWDAQREGSDTAVHEYLAIHRNAVRFVTVLDQADRPGSSGA